MSAGSVACCSVRVKLKKKKNQKTSSLKPTEHIEHHTVIYYYRPWPGPLWQPHTFRLITCPFLALYCPPVVRSPADSNLWDQIKREKSKSRENKTREENFHYVLICIQSICTPWHGLTVEFSLRPGPPVLISSYSRIASLLLCIYYFIYDESKSAVCYR